MLGEIAGYYGMNARGGSTRDALRLLEKGKYIGAIKLQDGTKTLAYSATEKGHLYLEDKGDGFGRNFIGPLNTAARRTALAVNRSILAFGKTVQMTNWITANELRADRNARAANSPAFDYDAVIELSLSGQQVRIGLILELRQR